MAVFLTRHTASPCVLVSNSRRPMLFLTERVRTREKGKSFPVKRDLEMKYSSSCVSSRTISNFVRSDGKLNT